MKSFEDSWKENRHVFESARNMAKAMYLEGQQSKQAEVDELRKRIDEALRVLNYASPTMLDKKAIRLLKGSKND